MERDQGKEGSMKMKKRIPMFIALAALTAAIAINVCVKEPELEPDEVYPLANSRISWEQTYYGGAWNE